MQRVARTTLIGLVSTLMLAALLIGCSAKLQEVSDTDSWFHVRVPSEWQTQSTPGSLLLYAAEELPGSDKQMLDELSVQVMTSNAASETPVPEELTFLLDARAEARGWKDAKIGKPAEVVIGGRKGYAADVSATDANGQQFAGRVALVRTNDREALIVALANAKSWDAEKSRVDDLFGEWYWHQPEQKATTDTEK